MQFDELSSLTFSLWSNRIPTNHNGPHVAGIVWVSVWVSEWVQSAKRPLTDSFRCQPVITSTMVIEREGAEECGKGYGNMGRERRITETERTNGYLRRSNAATSVNGTCASEVDNLRHLAFTRWSSGLATDSNRSIISFWGAGHWRCIAVVVVVVVAFLTSTQNEGTIYTMFHIMHVLISI